jgi:hypothetical protein
VGWRGGELEIGVSNGLSCGFPGDAEVEGQRSRDDGGRPAYQRLPVAGILHEGGCEK